MSHGFSGLIADGFRNLVSLVGTARDKATGWSHAYTPMTQEAIDNVYLSDWLGRKIVDIPPRDMTREWRTWEADQAEDIYATEKKFHLQSKLKQGMTWGRLYGGGCILIGDGAPNPTKPFDVEGIKKDGLKYLHVLTRWDLSPNDTITDLNDPDFGKPETYKIRLEARQGRNAVQSIRALGVRDLDIHRSRFVFFTGSEGTPNYTRMDWSWGVPIFQMVYDAIIRANATAANAAALTEEAKVDVLKIPDLMTHLQTVAGTQRVQERIALAATLKSNTSMLVMSGDEEFDRKQVSFAGLPELMHAHMEVASGAADIPLTRLLGQSPAGLNATGESDIRNYYDMLKSLQTTELSPSIEKLDEAIIRHTLGNKPKSVVATWNPLWQLSQAERADIGLKWAQGFQIINNANLFAPEEMRQSAADVLIESGFLPTLDQHMLSETEFEALLNEPPAVEGDPNAQGQQGQGQGGEGGSGPPEQGGRPQLALVSGFDEGFFQEGQHPRGQGGKWTEKGSTGVEGLRKKFGGSVIGPATAILQKALQKEGQPDKKAFFDKLSDAQLEAIASAVEKERTSTAVPTNSQVSQGGHMLPDGTYTTERQKLHRDILKKMFNRSAVRAATPAPGIKPDATFLGGRGGSGKSWLFGDDGPVDRGAAIYINPDDIKEALPEYQGWNAALLHEESSDITSLAHSMARQLGVSVIVDATMKTTSKMHYITDSYKSSGYDISGHYMFASPETAARRAVKRFMGSGRFVPPQYSLGSLTNEHTFDEMIPNFREWTVYSNNEDGKEPKLVARGDAHTPREGRFARFSSRGGVIQSMTVAGRRSI